MTTSTNREPQLAHNSIGSTGGLTQMQGRYLQTVRKLLVAYQRTHGMQQKHMFVSMIHAFMQELCGYPPNGYTVTNAVYSHATAYAPHVVPTSSSADLTLFYFTAADDPDDVHDLWVKQAQVYLVTPGKEDFIAEHATNVVCSNFFVIDGARKDPQTGAWNLWTASDIPGAQMARVDLQQGAHMTDRTVPMSQVIQKRLATLQYRHFMAS